MKMLLRAAFVLSVVALACPAAAQVATLPQVNNAGGNKVPSQGSLLIDSSGAEKGTVGNPLVVSGGGGGGGSSDGVAQASTTAGQSGVLAQCAAVSGDQTYTAGQTNPVTCTQTGRLRVGLSSASNIAPGTIGANTSAADLVGCKYVAAGVTFADGNTGVISCDSAGNLRAVPAATESHLGEVGGNQVTISNAQTVTASSAYATGNAVGGLITFTNVARVSGGSGLIQSVVAYTKSAQSSGLELWVFSANPSGSTCTDKTAFSVASADFDKVVWVFAISSWYSGGTPSVGLSSDRAIPYALSSGTSFYACLVTRSTPTYASTSDVSIAVRLIRN